MNRKITELIKPGPVLMVSFALLSLGFDAENANAARLNSIISPVNQLKRYQNEDIIIKGTVKDEKNLPLPGVSVKIKGLETGVSTDGQGNFSIKVPSATAILVFSFIGYSPKEVPVGTQTMLNIQLAPSATTLKDVQVVGIGYGTISSKEVTSAVTHVGTEDFRQGGSRNPLDLIQGKVPGLQLTRTGGSNPNSGISTQLRGAITVTGNSSPLYVIDGIPGGNPDLLQQDDIASIDVLKDGSGAAIYGTSANAGVIIITTKKGKAGPPQFNYSTYLRKEYVQNRQDFLSPAEFSQKVASGEIKQTDFGHQTDFYDQLINHDNLSQNHNLSINGGGDKTSYRASVNYRDLQGIAAENGRKEYTMRLNVNQKGFNDRLTAQFNLASNFNTANLLGGSGWEDEMAKNPTLSNFNEDGTYRFDRTSTNQYARLRQETNERKQQTTSADGKLELDITEGLKAAIFGSVTRDDRNDSGYRLKASEDSQENSDSPGGGFGFKENFLSQDFAVEPTLQYKTTFNEKHNFTAIGGYSYRYHLEESSRMENRGFLNDQLLENGLETGSLLAKGKGLMQSGKFDNTLIAFFGRINYSFNNKYLAQIIFRREGSTKFGANNKWGNFPAISAGWNLSEEDFLKDIKFINYLKLRVGYGITGNSGVANNASRVLMSPGGTYLYPDGEYYQTYGPDKNPNPDLKWETKREINIGVDYKMFDNRLTGSIDVFKRTTKDLLDTYTSQQPSNVLPRIITNVGSISSKGIEMAVSYAAVKSTDFGWNIDATASTLKNTLDSYSNDTYKVPYKTFAAIGGAGDLGDAVITFEGGKLGEFWGKKFAGFTDDGKWLFYNRNGEAVRNDQINNSKDKDVTDLQPLGNAIPKFYASLTNSFNYKNWDLRIFLRGKFGYKILNTTALTYGNKTWSGNLLKETFTKNAQLNDTYMYSDYYLENGANLKIDELTLGYNFKLDNKWARSIRVYATGQNLATITGYSGNDPDFIQDTGLAAGVDSRDLYPSTRSFVLGLNVGF